MLGFRGVQAAGFIRRDGVRYASLKALSIRIKSVSGTSKITKAMKLVAASKLKGAESRMNAMRPFAKGMMDFMGAKNPVGEDDAPTKHAIVAVSSDKGLCGGINTFISKAVRLNIASDAAKGIESSVTLIGQKSAAQLKREFEDKFVFAADEVYMVPPNFTLCAALAEEVLKQDFDQLTIYYNKFKSVISFDVVPEASKSLPSLLEAESMDEIEFDGGEGMDGDKDVVLTDLYEFYVATSIYSALLESSSSEQASRMSAMENATNNSRDLLNKLSLQYNRGRQAKITNELMEITSGAEAV